MGIYLRVENLLNSLTQNAVEDKSMGIFEDKVGTFLKDQVIESYGEEAQKRRRSLLAHPTD